ncbi:hypothetical protein JCM11641_002785 [Rhodosporidiobolus odoratus]
MPRTGSVTPTRGSPPLASTSYAPPPSSNADDPFLAQTAQIDLTEQDRQEGYDVELLNARPRGRASEDEMAGASDDSLPRGEMEKYGGAGLMPVMTHPGVGLGALPPPLPPVGAAPAGAGAMLGAGMGGLGAGGAAAKEAGYGGLEHGSGTTARSGKRKPWFMRPLPLGILALFLVAVALAVGLGVGLAKRNSSSHDDDPPPPVSASRSSSRSRTRTGTLTTGTVVPSSLYSSYTVDHPQTTDSASTSESTITSSADGQTASETDSSSVSVITSAPSPASGTTLATTGNLPIPAASATTISGSIIISALTADDTISLVTQTATARLRYGRRRYEWRG